MKVEAEGEKMTEQVAAILRLLDLQPHPEGGYYRESYRAPLVLSGLPHGSERNASTAIYFLLRAGTFSAFHRVRSDEVWHHYDGDSLLLHILSGDGLYEKKLVGRNLDAGERPQAIVPADSWQAAEPLGDSYSLCGCTVAPGFDFSDFQLAKDSELLLRFPEHAEIIKRFTRK